MEEKQEQKKGSGKNRPVVHHQPREKSAAQVREQSPHFFPPFALPRFCFSSGTASRLHQLLTLAAPESTESVPTNPLILIE
jgi:hypothetical protein